MNTVNTLEYKTIADWVTYDEFRLGMFSLSDGWRLPSEREWDGREIWGKAGYADENDYIHDAAKNAILEWIAEEDDMSFEDHYELVKSESTNHYVTLNTHGKFLVSVPEIDTSPIGEGTYHMRSCFVVVRDNPRLKYAA